MTDRRVILGQGEGARPYSHLLPIADAEREWGNTPIGDFEEGPDAGWMLVFRSPLHIDWLQEVFDIPPHIGIGRHDDGQTYVVDGESRVSISSPATQQPPWPAGLARMWQKVSRG